MNKTARSPMEWIRRVAGRLDILVVMPYRVRDRFAGYMRVEKAVGAHVWPLDILVRGADEVESRLKIGDSFMREIVNRGKVLYAAPPWRK